MHNKSPKHNFVAGFTIVELLIVIVVIAILATISIVAYTSLAQRASNARTIAGIQQYHRALQMYKFNEGHHPPTPGEGSSYIAMTCLGLGYQDGKCGDISGSATYESATFMAGMQQKSDVNLSAIINDRSGAVGGELFTGAVYGIDIVDASLSSTGRGRVIDWVMEGQDTPCVLPGSWAYSSANGNTACEIFLEEY